MNTKFRLVNSFSKKIDFYPFPTSPASVIECKMLSECAVRTLTCTVFDEILPLMIDESRDITLEIIDKSTRKVSAWLSFPVDFRFFEGHFPGNPIVPGVLHIETVLMLVRKMLNRPVRLRAIRRCKFLAPVKPETRIFVDVSIMKNRIAEWVFMNENRRTVFSKGVLAFFEGPSGETS